MSAPLPPPLPPDDLVGSLADLTIAGLEALVAAGATEEACRLAGRAHMLLRHARPGAARRFDVFLHRRTRTLTWNQPPRSGPGS